VGRTTDTDTRGGDYWHTHTHTSTRNDDHLRGYTCTYDLHTMHVFICDTGEGSWSHRVRLLAESLFSADSPQRYPSLPPSSPPFLPPSLPRDHEFLILALDGPYDCLSISQFLPLSPTPSPLF